MKMNKYQKALLAIKKIVIDERADGFYHPRTVADFYCDDVDILQELADNPPLKIEELKEGMWVWDDKIKSYIYIFELLYWKPVKAIIYAGRIINDPAHGFCIDFEENRFYRREVPQEGQENE
ncbi:MAG: hypothetical protein SO231_08815 [Phocaeicola vulgatus]|nr:hypothetical protein [Phocaeicola vulgatus]